MGHVKLSGMIVGFSPKKSMVLYSRINRVLKTRMK